MNSEYTVTVHQLFIDFKKAYDSLRTEILYSILIEFCVPMNLVWRIKMCFNWAYSKVCLGKYLSDTFPVQTDLGNGGVLSLLLFNFALELPLARSTKTR
jgi:hypothetical protein